MSECTHSSTELRFRILSNNTRSVQLQCVVCGRAGGNPIKQATLTVDQLAALPPWDQCLQEKWDAQQRNEYLAADQKRLAEFEIQRIERTEKYREYLRSDAWLRKRELVLERDRHWCQACLSARATQVHHKTYDHIFDELMWELESVCTHCHERIHAK